MTAPATVDVDTVGTDTEGTDTEGSQGLGRMVAFTGAADGPPLHG
jgi:hypothetical protein